MKTTQAEYKTDIARLAEDMAKRDAELAKRDTEAAAGADKSGPTAVPRTNGEAPASASPRKRGHLRLVK